MPVYLDSVWVIQMQVYFHLPNPVVKKGSRNNLVPRIASRFFRSIHKHQILGITILAVFIFRDDVSQARGNF
jgi:hypothetical protein